MKTVSLLKMAERFLEQAGWVPERCEHFAFGRRHDLFGFADLMAYKAGHLSPTVALIQVTSASNMAARRRKVEANEHARRLSLVMDVVVMAWRDGVGWKAERYRGQRWSAWSADGVQQRGGAGGRHGTDNGSLG